MSKFSAFRLVLSAALISALGPAQTPPKEFDVATIKPNAANDNRFMIRPLPGGGLTITGVPLRMLIMEAYDVRAFQVTGGPGWMSTERWDIEARAEGVQGRLPIDQEHLMLQALIHGSIPPGRPPRDQGDDNLRAGGGQEWIEANAPHGGTSPANRPASC
jgi:hypothetical protein